MKSNESAGQPAVDALGLPIRLAVQGFDGRDNVPIADATVALFLRARLLKVAVSFNGLRRALGKSFKRWSSWFAACCSPHVAGTGSVMAHTALLGLPIANTIMRALQKKKQFNKGLGSHFFALRRFLFVIKIAQVVSAASFFLCAKRTDRQRVAVEATAAAAPVCSGANSWFFCFW